eukprot:TRINITY_DN1154_c0_g1_i5.p1 TRINITY_DN1154_c0_g1~~TRINITY_DN1154_c0_g1_i5.p1  ORF type:complete len:556 (+),score=110.97 TRINITY_DN1154_c0_g1_i5:1122-2789(+)
MNYQSINFPLLSPSTPNSRRKCALFFFLVWTILVFSLSVAALIKTMEVSIEQRKPQTYPTQLASNFDLQRAGNIPQGKVVSVSQPNSYSQPKYTQNSQHTNNNKEDNRDNESVNNNNKQLVVGAGTSVYSLNTFLTGQSLKHVAMATLDEETFIVAYMGSTTQVMAGKLLADTYAVQWGTPLTISMEIDGLVCLNSTSCVVLGSPYVAPLTVTPVQNQAPSLSIGSLVSFTSQMSVEPVITTLGSTGFAISYYESTSQVTLHTRYGTVLPQGIFLSTPIQYGPDYSSHGIIGLSDSTYLLLFVNSTQFSPGELSAIYVMIEGGNIVLSGPVSLTNSQAYFFFDGISVNENLAVVAFVDVGMDNALRVITIEIENSVPTFAAGLIVNNGDATGVTPSGLWMFISVSYISPTTFVVVYSDLANGLVVTASIIDFTETMSLTESNSGWVLTIPSPSLSGYYFISSTSLSSARFLVFDALYGAGSGGQITLGEIKGEAVGVVSNNEVVLWGLLKVNQVLQAGVVYYANTKGDIVQSDGTEDAKLGVAVNSNTLYLSLGT